MRNTQLADLMRPKNFDEIVGQKHLFGERGVVRKMTSAGRINNMINVNNLSRVMDIKEEWHQKS